MGRRKTQHGRKTKEEAGDQTSRGSRREGPNREGWGTSYFYPAPAQVRPRQVHSLKLPHDWLLWTSSMGAVPGLLATFTEPDCLWKHCRRTISAAHPATQTLHGVSAHKITTELHFFTFTLTRFLLKPRDHALTQSDTSGHSDRQSF